MRFLLCFMLLSFAAFAQEREVNPHYMLSNQDGRTVTDQSYRGNYTLVTFGYTHCPDICPTTLGNLSGAMELLGDKAEKVIPIFITVDPERDTAAHLKEYVKAFHPRLVGLTGPLPYVQAAVKEFKAEFQKVGSGENYSVDHSTGIYLVSPGAKFIAKFNHNLSPQELADKIRQNTD